MTQHRNPCPSQPLTTGLPNDTPHHHACIHDTDPNPNVEHQCHCGMKWINNHIEHSDTQLDVNAARAAITKAHNHICDIAEGKTRWTMRIPADEQRDSDLILAVALKAAEDAIAELADAREANAGLESAFGMAEGAVGILRQQRDQVLALCASREAEGIDSSPTDSDTIWPSEIRAIYAGQEQR